MRIAYILTAKNNRFRHFGQSDYQITSSMLVWYSVSSSIAYRQL